jgi:uncharacterized protein YdaU (DUF1376 family)
VIWYKFHIGDYITHTLHLSDAEDLAYRRLLDLYYMSERPIPLETDAVSRKIRLDLDITESVLTEFFEKSEDGYRNPRCDSEISRYQRQVETNRELGKRGGRPKKTESKTDSKPNDNPNKKKKENKDICRFDDFWDQWPTSKRKVARAACEAKWGRMKLDHIADRIIASVALLKGSEQWLAGYEPAPMTYLNQRRWEDDSDVNNVPARRVI